MRQWMTREPRSLSNQVVAITGGARGIGHATARALAYRGARVAIGDLTAEEPGGAPVRQVGAAGIRESAGITRRVGAGRRGVFAVERLDLETIGQAVAQLLEARARTPVSSRQGGYPA